MNWLNTLITAIATAAIGTVVSGYLANRSVRWYRISSFEGGSGYYVVGLALGGLVAGFIIGLVISRLVAGSAHPSTYTALLYSVTTMLCVAGVTGGIARLLADIPRRLRANPSCCMSKHVGRPAGSVHPLILPASPISPFAQSPSFANRVPNAVRCGKKMRAKATQVGP